MHIFGSHVSCGGGLLNAIDRAAGGEGARTGVRPLIVGLNGVMSAYHTPPRATVIASPFTPPAASLHRNAITWATSRGSRTRFCG